MIWNENAECMGRQEKEEMQLALLQKQVKRVYENVPFYKKKFDDAGFHPDKDAYELIRDDIAMRKAQITNETAVKELKLRDELYTVREDICDKVFSEAKEKLLAFASSDEYSGFITASLNEIAALFDGDPCRVSTSPKDEALRELILSILPNAEINTNPKIAVGGIKALCSTKGILADDTLDTRLAEQKEWFIENAGLKVV